jgi:hypothetical protein
MTVGEANELLLELDDLLFKAETGQIEMSWAVYRAHQTTAEELVVVVAQALSRDSGKPYEEMYNLHNKIKSLKRVQATANLHQKLHPDLPLTPEEGNFLARFLDESATEEEAKQMFTQFNTKVYGYLFANAPRPPEIAEAKRQGILSRFFRS